LDTKLKAMKAELKPAVLATGSSRGLRDGAEQELVLGTRYRHRGCRQPDRLAAVTLSAIRS